MRPLLSNIVSLVSIAWKINTVILCMAYTFLFCGCEKGVVLHVNEDLYAKLHNKVVQVEKDSKEHRKIIGVLVPAVHLNFIKMNNNILRLKHDIARFERRAIGSSVVVYPLLGQGGDILVNGWDNCNSIIYRLSSIEDELHSMQMHLNRLECTLSQTTESSSWIPSVSSLSYLIIGSSVLLSGGYLLYKSL